MTEDFVKFLKRARKQDLKKLRGIMGDRVLYRISGQRLRKPPSPEKLEKFSKKLDEILGATA